MPSFTFKIGRPGAGCLTRPVSTRTTPSARSLRGTGILVILTYLPPAFDGWRATAGMLEKESCQSRVETGSAAELSSGLMSSGISKRTVVPTFGWLSIVI